MLLVHEFASTGLWLPGGAVDTRERLEDAAVRETREEAGVDVVLTGVLKLQYAPHRGYVRLRAIFMAEPKNEARSTPKSVPDYESGGAVWADMREVANGAYPLRGSEPQTWASYLLRGGVVHPLGVLGGETE